MAALAETSKLLRRADGARVDPATATAFHLWQLAARAAESPGARVFVYRHALIHAGYLLTSRGGRYRRCPVCRASLP